MKYLRDILIESKRPCAGDEKTARGPVNVSLPLFASDAMARRSGLSTERMSALADDLAWALNPSADLTTTPSTTRAPLMLVNGTAGHLRSTRVLLNSGYVVVIRGNAKSLVIQDWFEPSTSRPSFNEFGRDDFVVSRIVRHAHLDADRLGFTPPPAEQLTQFEHRANWGFENVKGGMMWVGGGVYEMGADKVGVDLKQLNSSSGNAMYLSRCGIAQARFVEFGDDAAAGRGDPLLCARGLRAARLLCERAGEASGDVPAALSLRLARALGRCRLFGVKLKAVDDFTLGEGVFFAAARELIDQMAKSTRTAIQFDDEALAGGAEREEETAAGLLETRMDAWATYLALDEVVGLYRSRGDSQSDEAAKMLTEAAAGIEKFDTALEQMGDGLRIAAGTQMLANWRLLLAPGYREVLPWWFGV